MSKFKHPIRSIREPFGKAGLTVAICALVLAMVGGAYAAGGLTKSQEKQVKKIAKKYAGKPGAAGVNGTNGTNGTNGAKGDPGVGTKGDPGEPGTSVTNTPLAKGEGGCPEGGAKFTVGADTTKACNGKNGAIQPGETLPSEATETGVWAVSSLGVAEEAYASISFTIPLAAPLSNAPECGEPGEPTCQVHYIKEGEGAPEGCTGGTAEKPSAEPGNLCVYTAYEELLTSGTIFDPITGGGGAARTGAFGLFFFSSTSYESQARGTWAVTAE